MVDFGKIFKSGGVAEQFLMWQIMAQLAQPLMAPMLQTIANEIWQLDPNVPVPADTLAVMVNRGLLSMTDGINESSKTGIGESQFRKLVDSAGSPPALNEIIELWRRGAIQQGAPDDSVPSFERALKDSGVRDDWIPLLADLKINKPSQEEALNALLQGQITRERSYALWLQAGGDPDWFQDAFNSQGTAPTPDMAGTMANRGIIPWDGEGANAVTFRQAFLEGPWRNKWEPSMRRLMEYLPPPRTVTAMVRAGSITDAQALALLRKEGLTQELAAAYLADAHHTKTAAQKELSQAQIKALYKDHKITQAKAEQLIEALGYSKENAGLIISLADVAKADTHLTAAMGRIHTLYVAHKLNRLAAHAALVSLHIGDQQITDLFALWDIEVESNVRLLTPAQITSAWDNKIMTQDEALQQLQHLGYSAYDAWVVLSEKAGKPLADKPASTGGPGVNP